MFWSGDLNVGGNIIYLSFEFSHGIVHGDFSE